MAGAGARKRLEENQSRLTMLLVLCLVGTATFIAVRLTMYKQSTYLEHWIGYAATILIELLVYVAIRAAAQPVFDAAGRLLDGGADLNKGMVSSYHDLLYMTVLVQLVAAFSNWGWCARCCSSCLYGVRCAAATPPACAVHAPPQRRRACACRTHSATCMQRPVLHCVRRLGVHRCTGWCGWSDDAHVLPLPPPSPLRRRLIYAIVPGYGLYYFTTKALIPALKEEAPQQQVRPGMGVAVVLCCRAANHLCAGLLDASDGHWLMAAMPCVAG